MDMEQEDEWLKSIRVIEGKIGCLFLYMERSALKTALRNWYREDLHNTVIWKASLETFSIPKNPFKIHPTVSSSSLSRVICNLRVGIADIGNIIPPPDAARVTVCPLCRKKGRLMKLDVTHVIATCAGVYLFRRSHISPPPPTYFDDHIFSPIF